MICVAVISFRATRFQHYSFFFINCRRFSPFILNILLNYVNTSLLSTTFFELKSILNGIIRNYGETM